MYGESALWRWDARPSKDGRYNKRVIVAPDFSRRHPPMPEALSDGISGNFLEVIGISKIPITSKFKRITKCDW